jgi:hypothetical protein
MFRGRSSHELPDRPLRRHCGGRRFCRLDWSSNNPVGLQWLSASAACFLRTRGKEHVRQVAAQWRSPFSLRETDNPQRES